MDGGVLMDGGWAEKVTRAAFKCFDSLQRKGKPRDRDEWTTLSSFLICIGESMEVVSCATGTRCLGKSQLNSKGDRLHDSHAEVLARRAFQRYLMVEIANIYNGRPSKIIQWNGSRRKASLSPGVRVVFFTTQTPCGDGSIFVRPKGDIHPEMVKRLDVSEAPPAKKYRPSSSSSGEQEGKNDEDRKKAGVESVSNSHGETQEWRKKYLVDNVKYVREELTEGSHDLYRTGAKCVAGAEQDQLLPGCQYHVMGVLRTKPGRGDPTLSLSCSDKIARWNILGCQGCFSMIFLEEPVYLDSIVISGCSFDEEAMIRAMYGRLDHSKLDSPFRLNKPAIHYTNTPFIYNKQHVEHNTLRTSAAESGSKITACSSSLIWYRHSLEGDVTEVSVNGYKQGVTKKALQSEISRLKVCRSNMFKELQRIFGGLDSSVRILLLGRDILPSCYQSSKDLIGYTRVWNALTTSDEVFKWWPRKGRHHSLFDTDNCST